jgi:N4-gp56 family major capsid protein
MTTYSATNIADVSTLDTTVYQRKARLAFAEACQFLQIVNPLYTYSGPRSITVSKITGLDVNTTATTDGTAEVISQVTHGTTAVTWSEYKKTKDFTDLAQVGGNVDLLDALWRRGQQVLPEEFDEVASKALISGSSAYRVNGRAAITDIVDNDNLNAATIRIVVAKLKGGKAPKFLINGQLGYLGFIHPYALHDVLSESSGLNLLGPANVNSPEYRANSLGFAAGVHWFESSSSQLWAANAGSGGTVDVAKTIIMGDESVAFNQGPITPHPNMLDLPFNDAHSMVVRLLRPDTEQGLTYQVACISRIGFGVLDTAGVYRIESTSELGTNS